MLRVPVIEPQARPDQAPGRRLVAQPPSHQPRCWTALIPVARRNATPLITKAPQTCQNWPSGGQLLDIYLIMIINKKKLSG